MSPESPWRVYASASDCSLAPVSSDSASRRMAPPTFVVRWSWRGNTMPEKKRAAIGNETSSSVGK